jgi:hypothetical protein
VRRHKASEHDLVAKYLCLSARMGGVGMPYAAAEKFVLKLPSWAERLQNDMAAADRDYEAEGLAVLQAAMRS